MIGRSGVDRTIIFTFIMGLALVACSSGPEWRLLGTYEVPDTEVIPLFLINLGIICKNSYSFLVC
jgi:hypothetical protein